MCHLNFILYGSTPLPAQCITLLAQHRDLWFTVCEHHVSYYGHTPFFDEGSQGLLRVGLRAANLKFTPVPVAARSKA